MIKLFKKFTEHFSHPCYINVLGTLMKMKIRTLHPHYLNFSINNTRIVPVMGCS